MIRAIFYGLLVLLVVDAMWLVSSIFGVMPAAGLLAGHVGSFLAAAITAYLAPRKRDLLGMLIAVPAAVLMVAVPMIYGEMGGSVDSLDTTGMAVVTYWLLFKSLILCGIGSTIGSFLARRRLSRTAWRRST